MSLFPPLVCKRHQNVWVVRDDLFRYGSKARFLYWYFKRLKKDGVYEVVYGSSPRWGYAQVSIAFLARYFGIKFTLFIAKSKELHPYTKEAQRLGTRIVSVPMGFLKVTEARARDYARTSMGRLLLPIGLDVPEAIGGIQRWAGRLSIRPDEVWTVASSGTLTRGLQTVWPGAAFYAVQVGHKIAKGKAGFAEIIECPLAFNKPAPDPPPFPSVPEYDAKAWSYIPKDGNRLRLFWNVGGKME